MPQKVVVSPDWTDKERQTLIEAIEAELAAMEKRGPQWLVATPGPERLSAKRKARRARYLTRRMTLHILVANLQSYDSALLERDREKFAEFLAEP